MGVKIQSMDIIGHSLPLSALAMIGDFILSHRDCAEEFKATLNPMSARPTEHITNRISTRPIEHITNRIIVAKKQWVDFGNNSRGLFVSKNTSLIQEVATVHRT